MKVETFKHENVLPDGTFSDKSGAVRVKGGIRMSQNNGGCGLDACRCSDGHWITIAKPRTKDGIVEGLCVRFDNQLEMEEFFKNRNMDCE